jgi:hypothetical protein
MGIKPKTRVILEERHLLSAISCSLFIPYLRRAYKHTDTPSQHEIIEQIKNAVWGDIHEVFEFDEVKDE